MTEIQSLQAEIEAIETELVKLRTERSPLEQPSLAPVGGPEQIATAAKAAAVSLAERKPQLDGIDHAIALLEQQLLPKQRLLAQLNAQAEMEQEQLERAERLKVAQAKIQDRVKKIYDLSAQLETAFWELKSLHREFNSDYRGAQEKPAGTGFGWTVQNLIEFKSTQVPEVLTLGDRFVVQSRSIDLFKPEKEAGRMAQLQKSAAHAETREEAHRSRQLAEAEQAKRREIERLQGLLAGKHEELRGYERQVASLLDSGYTKAGSNLRLDDSILGRLKAEIHELETQLQQHEK